MTTHTFGSEVFALFDQHSSAQEQMLQFIWGKKDFRVYLQPASRALPLKGTAPLRSAAGEAWMLCRLQFLSQFEWLDYVKVAGHGLASEEVLWRKGNATRYVDLPKGFLKIALMLACKTFGLEKEQEAA